jgi:lysozyme family protein
MRFFDFFSWFKHDAQNPAPVEPPTQYRDLKSECVTKLDDDQTSDLNNFISIFKNNIDKYNQVGFKAGVPPMLVAALHYREASGDFTCYLSQGDPLGTRNYANGDSNNGHSLPASTPNTILYTDWEEAAIFALNYETRAKAVSGISYQETDIGDILTFSIYYNGLGYNNRNVPDPYILAGTTCYTSGKFTSDGTYSSSAVDGQLGVLVMLRAIMNINVPILIN